MGYETWVKDHGGQRRVPLIFYGSLHIQVRLGQAALIDSGLFVLVLDPTA